MNCWSESVNFEHISNAVDRLKMKVEKAYFECRNEDAGNAHDDLTSAEWRLRQADRRRSK